LLGIDIGATKALAVVASPDRVLHRRRWETGRHLDPEAAAELVDEVVAWARALEPGLGAIGIGFPGIVLDGRVVSSVMLDGWSNTDVVGSASDRCGLAVVVDNDVNCAAIAEHQVRGGFDDLLLVAVGTGVGGAIVIGGALWHGVGGLAGEIGHTSGVRGGGPCDCGGRDCLHLAVGGRALEARLGAGPGSLSRVAGTPEGMAELRGAAELVGIAAADAISVLALPLVVVTGGLTGHPGFVEMVSSSFHRHVMAELSAMSRVERAAAGDDAAALGAAMLARASIEPQRT
jgi:glucokinase